jgi:hypothetical protein
MRMAPLPGTTAMPLGRKKEAAEPSPSLLPELKLAQPATVLTEAAEALILLTVCAYVSAT